MPVFSKSVVVEAARGIKVFLALRVGATRGRVPDFETPAKQQQSQGNPQMQQQIKNQRQQLERTKREL